jgi:hypothetical protein
MRMPVMRVGKMMMNVRNGIVLMPVRMSHPGTNLLVMAMVMVDIAIGSVHMVMRVRHRLVRMSVLVLLGEVHCNTKCHQEAGSDQLQRHRFSQQHDGQECAEKWCDRKIGTRARSPKIAQTHYKQNKTDAVAEKSQ